MRPSVRFFSSEWLSVAVLFFCYGAREGLRLLSIVEHSLMFSSLAIFSSQQASFFCTYFCPFKNHPTTMSILVMYGGGGKMQSVLDNGHFVR